MNEVNNTNVVSALWVILAIVAVLGLVAGQMFVLRCKAVEYATASLQAKAVRHRIFVRTLLASFVSITWLMIAGYILRTAHAEAHRGLILPILFCGAGVIFFFFVPLPPAGLIAVFGIAMARVIWSVVFGFSLSLVAVLLLEYLGGMVL